ncbi:MAG: ATP-binding protein [Solirubrobacteraceae bacterium]
MIALFVLTGLAGALYVHARSESDAKAQAVQEARFASDSAAKTIAGGAGTLRTALASLAAQPAAVAQLLASPAKCALSFARTGPLTGHVDILRGDGALVCSSLARPAKRGYTGAAWLARARGGPLALAPVTDPETGAPAALFSVPLHDAIAAAFVDLRTLGPSLIAELAGPQGLGYLVTSADGATALAESQDSSRWSGQSIVRTAFFRAGDRSQRPGLEGQQRLFARTGVPGLGWRVYAGINRSVALSAATGLFDRYLEIILAALVVVLIAAAIVHRGIARPIARLGAAVRRGPSAAGDEPSAAGGPVEVRALAAGFEELASTVARQLGDREQAEALAREAEETARAAESQARAAEAEARTAEQEYRRLFETNPQPMWIYEAETLRIVEVNAAAVSSYGYSRQEFQAMTLRDLRPPEDEAAMLRSVADAPPRDRSGPWRHLKRDGTTIEVEILSHAIDFRGRRARFVMATDITERARLQRQLAQVTRLESLGLLAGGVAHDFNNLLAVILNYAAFAEEAVGAAVAQDPERWSSARDDIAEVQEAARRASRLTHQLLAFARREVVRPEVVSLNDVVRGTAQLLRRTLGEHIELTLTLADDLAPVLADPGQLEQVLVNLAVNARDAMPSGGTLIVQTANLQVDDDYAGATPGLEPGPHVRLRVSDTGQGMDRATADRAFEPFFTTKSEGEGTGLGLATVYGIVSEMGAQVRLYSEPGVGTTCTVLVPVTERRLEVRAQPAALASNGSGEVVLLVEDEAGIREIGRRILHRSGYSVLTAADGQHAITLAREHDGPIDLLITDVVMPGMMGSEVAARVRELRPQVRVVYMSGYAQALLDENRTLPSHTILVEKPFSGDELLAKVREALA